MNKKIIDLDSLRPHETKYIICLCCFKDWQAVFPINTNINKLECPDCQKQNSIEFTLVTAKNIIKTLKNK
tara:strand:- start:91 stop:300 length:210 start_codon:yes stop_codon:yes gene_type:complete